MTQKNLSKSPKMFKITQTDSLPDRMFELIHAKAKAWHAWVFLTSFAVILSAVALPIVLKAEFNLRTNNVHYHFLFSKVQATAL